MENPLTMQNPLISKKKGLPKTIYDGDCIKGHAFDLTLYNDLLESHKYI